MYTSEILQLATGRDNVIFTEDLPFLEKKMIDRVILDCLVLVRTYFHRKY